MTRAVGGQSTAGGLVEAKGVVVEFAGLPGSGKSAVAARTQAALMARGVRCSVADAPVSAAAPRMVRLVRRVGLATAQLCTSPGDAPPALRAVRRAGRGSTRDGLLAVLQWLAVRRLATVARRHAGIHLLEEGQAQTMWTLALRGRTGAQHALRPECLATLVVVVEAPTDVLSRRLAGRASVHSRTQRLPEPARVEELRLGRVLLEQVLAVMPCPQLRLTNDGTSTPDELAERLADRVLSETSGLSSLPAAAASPGHAQSP